MTKSTITRKAALENALVFCNYANMTALSIEGYENIDWVETANVLGNMLKQISKPRAAAESKAHKMNVNLATEIVAEFPDEGLTTKGIVALGNPNIGTTQKAAAVMRVAETLGLVTKVTEKKVITYVPVR
jgi:hypothetical protein